MADLVRHGWTLEQRLEAFEIWFAQLGANGERNVDDVATVMGIPIHVVKRWKKLDAWEDKAAQREGKVLAKLEELGVEKVADIKATYFKRVQSLLNKWFTFHLDDPEREQLLLATTNVDDIIKLLKALLVLGGEPDTIKRLERTNTNNVDDVLKNLSTDELRALLKGRAQVVDAEVVETADAEETN